METEPHLSAFLSTIVSLTEPLKASLYDLSCVYCNYFLLYALFGYKLGTYARMIMLFVLQGKLGPLSPDNPGMSGISRDLRQWILHDGPSPPALIHGKSIVVLVTYLLPSIWATLDLKHLLQTCNVALGPVKIPALCWVSVWLFQPQPVQRVTMRVGEWALAEPVYYVPLYGVTAYVLSLQGHIYAVEAFLCVSWMLVAAWPAMSEKKKLIFRLVAIIPWIVLRCLVLLPFAPVWLFRQTLKIPYFWAKQQACKLWYGFLQGHSPRQGQESYKYSCLASGEIRLLRLYRTSNRKLQCQMHHVKLEEAPDYEAISYTWGDPKLQHGIIVDKKWLEVTSNAYEILQDRASLYRSTLLWIDCICINQADDDEKSSQVAMMSDIYRQATRVIMWLGLSPDAEQAFSLLGDLYERPITWSELPATQQALFQPFFQGRAQRFALFDKYDPRFAALARLLKHSYFFRVWITQEIVFGKTVHVRCGGCWIDWTRFSSVIMLFCDPEHWTLVGRQELYRHMEEPNGLGQIGVISTLKDQQHRRELLSLEKPRLCDVLVELWMGKATDSRDMIYGYLNLAREASLPEFAVDYKSNKNATELYTATARLFLERNELLDIMYVAGIGYPRKLELLPSWVPDWSSPPIVSTLRRIKGTQTAFYRASKGTLPQIRLVEPNLLSVRGSYLDKISATMAEPFAALLEVTSVDLRNKVIMAEIWRRIEAQELALKLPQIYLNGQFHGQSRDDAFWRTLIGDTMVVAVAVGDNFKVRPDTLGVAPYSSVATIQRPADDDYGRFFQEWKRISEVVLLSGITQVGEIKRNAVVDRTERASDMSKLRDQFTHSFTLCASGRKFAITEKGYMAMVPPLTKAGDDIGIIYGAEVPFVFRRCAKPASAAVYDLVGECYVHGVMDGEASREKCDDDMVFLLG